MVQAGSSLSEMCKAIVAPQDLVLNTREAQRLAMLFDTILLYPLSRGRHSAEDIARQHEETQFLVGQGVVARLGWSMPFALGRTDGSMLRMDDNCEIKLPFGLIQACIPRGAGGDGGLDPLLRNVAWNLMFNHAPVTAHADLAGLPLVEGPAHCMQIVIDKVPMPPENMPWQDLLQFRKEEESRASLRELRVWMQKQAQARAPVRAALEELEALLERYRKYMKLQHKKYGEGVIGTLLVSAEETIKELLDLRVGSALKTLVDFRSRSIALSEAELLAPGREVSYFARAREFLDRERPSLP